MGKEIASKSIHDRPNVKSRLRPCNIINNNLNSRRMTLLIYVHSTHRSDTSLNCGHVVACYLFNSALSRSRNKIISPNGVRLVFHYCIFFSYYYFFFYHSKVKIGMFLRAWNRVVPVKSGHLAGMQLSLRFAVCTQVGVFDRLPTSPSIAIVSITDTTPG